MYYYKEKGRDDGAIKKQLNALAHQYPRDGYWKLYHLLRQRDILVNPIVDPFVKTANPLF